MNKLGLDIIIPVALYDPVAVFPRMEALMLTLPRYVEAGATVYLVESIIPGAEPIFTQWNNVSGIRHISVTCEFFNKGWLINLGYANSYSPMVCIAEADMLPAGPNYFQDVLRWINSNDATWCIGWNHLLYTNEEARKYLIDRYVRDGEISGGFDLRNYLYAKLKCKDWRTPKHRGTEGGYVFFERDFFEDIGMAPENYWGLGGIDNDIAIRAAYCEQYRSAPQTAYHLWHDRSGPKESLGPKGFRDNGEKVRMLRADPVPVIEWLREHVTEMADPEGPLLTPGPYDA